MATQSYIIERENIIRDAEKRIARGIEPRDDAETIRAVRELTEALRYEQQTGGIPANRDYWGTARINALLLKTVKGCDPELWEACQEFTLYALNELDLA